MDPQLLKYYNRELQFIREMGGEFAREFPKIAGRLGLEEFECADPYVERLLEGFAFLSARVQLKLDSEFPRFTQHLLEMVYPHYLSPTPSMMVAQFQPDLKEGTLVEGYVMPRGTSLRSLLGKGEQTACEYRTAHDTTLWPIEIVNVDYFSRDVSNISLPSQLQKVRAGVRIQLKTTPGVKFSDLKMENLTFFVRGGQQRSKVLYEQIFADLEGVLIRPTSGAWHEVLDKNSVFPVGFSDEQAMLPTMLESFQGYRLLHEYFAFHQRFMFFDVRGMQRAIKRCNESTLEMIVLLNRVDSSLENVVDSSNLALFCTPAINLFPHRADRIHINERDAEYHVVPDRTRPMDLEVYQLTGVTGYSEDESNTKRFRSFYSHSDPAADAGEDQMAFYTLHRMQRVLSTKQRRMGPRASYIGSELFISLVDAKESPYSYDLNQLDINTLCTNRDLPLLMPLGKGKTDFTLHVGAPVQSIRCVAGPTEPKPSFDFVSGANVWRLISHLSLNYLSLVDSDQRQGAAALRELLRLYADIFEVDQRKLVDGLRSVESKPIIRRLPGSGPMTFGRGVEISLTCDETAFEGYGTFLLGAVLSRFFAKYVSINSFTETILRSNDRGEIMRWPATIGTRHVI